MLIFFGTLLAALIGSMLAPTFLQFLNTSKNKQDERLEYLEESYLLARKIFDYSVQMTSHIAWLIAANQGQIKISSIPKQPEEPFSRMHIVLDYHLKAPENLKAGVKALHDEILFSFRSIAEAINNPQEKAKFYLQAVNEVVSIAKKGPAISDEITTWVKNEKIKIDSAVSIFSGLFWSSLCKKIWGKIKISITRAV